MAMARARFTRRRDALVSVACVIAVLCVADSGDNFAQADCWYNDENHEEGTQVFTPEPCLNCTCSRNALLCYLRVCPKLPNPPPPGCILLHRYRTCCPELICTDFLGGGNSIEARSDAEGDLLDMPMEDYSYKDACFLNGSVYGPGSAMHSSSFCEYCYCLGGKQICVKPKCLMPLEGCAPVYDPTSCCPIKYDCGTRIRTSTTTTTTEMEQTTIQDGCTVDGTHHTEGSKVIGIGHSVCDNCYCLRGLLRCEPLSCAPPLLGCTPVVKPGECCAASYNCNGSIDIDPEPNYGYHPTVSKEYAKLRKEVQRKPGKEGVVTVAPLYVLPESLENPSPNKMQQRHANTFGTTRHFVDGSIISSTEIPSSSRIPPENDKSTYSTTTSYEFHNTNYKRVYSTTFRTKEIELHSNKIAPHKKTDASTNTLKNKHKHNVNDFFTFDDINILSLVDSLLDGRLYRQAEKETEATTESNSNKIANATTPIQNEILIETTTTTPSTKIPNDLDTTYFSSEVITTTEEISTQSNEIYPVTVKNILNSTDCINNIEESSNNIFDYTTVIPIDPQEVNNLSETKTEVFSTTDDTFSTTAMPENKSLETRNKFTSDIFSILNQTKSKRPTDYDYDYSEPTLPPSLPNLKIIPFLAADAVDTKNELIKESPVYVAEKSDSNFNYGAPYFSSPDSPQGGFVPKDTDTLEAFYDNVLSLTSRPQGVDCLTNGKEILHGMSVSSNSPCTTCTCFYGNIVCRKPNCPPPNAGCRVASEEGVTLCCPNYICDDPTVLLLPPVDRIDIPQEIVTVAEGILHSAITNADPFKDVIKTEPAPDLESLIGDMIYQRLSTSTIRTTTGSMVTQESKTNLKLEDNQGPTTAETEGDNGFGLDSVLQFILGVNKDKDSDQANNSINVTNTNLSTLVENNLETQINKTSFINGNITHNETNPTNLTNNKSIEMRNSNATSVPGVGLLKLAGCNIYGRMYRVGRIISELSGPCRECKCTEVGVQCKTLKCWKS